MPVAGIFLPWWGPAPGWEGKFIARSFAINSLQVILVGDAAKWEPWAGVPRIPCTMDEFEARVSATVGFPVKKNDPHYPRCQAVCEFRPLMADMYPEYCKYEWWGWGDWDCVWGDWDSFLTDETLARYDMISSASYTVNGPFQLFRKEFSQLYRKRLDIVASPTCENHLDERGMELIVAAEQKAGRIRCLYPADIVAHDRHEKWNRCTFKGNKLYRMDSEGLVGDEIMYFHFPRVAQWPC
jgi:hypothetical protein